MDEEQARFLLAAYRPDGADAADPDFAEALALATRDRELGEWLAAERAHDAEFSAAISSTIVPPDLREEILAGAAVVRGDLPQSETRDDATMIGAIASLRPPDELCGRIKIAMVATQPEEATVGSVVSRWRRWVLPLTAAAAGIALAFVFTRGKTPSSVAATTLPRVEAGFVRTVSAPGFELDEKGNDSLVLIADLKARGLPCPCCLPKGLSNAKTIGCRKLEIDGKQGSVICFLLDDDRVVHLLSFRREDISCKLPSHAKPKIVRNGDWAVAKWATDERVFMLAGEMDPERLTRVF